MEIKDEVLKWWKKNESTLLNLAKSNYNLTEDDAMEIVQEVAILVLRKLPLTVTNENIFKKWVKTTLRNRIIDWFRKNKRQKIVDKVSQSSIGPNQEEVLFLKQILGMVGKLPGKQKSVMVKILEGKSVSNIAEEFKIEKATVRSILRHARTNLNKTIEKQERRERL